LPDGAEDINRYRPGVQIAGGSNSGKRKNEKPPELQSSGGFRLTDERGDI
jgi:hypothetical protein